MTKAALARGLELGNDNVRGSRQKSLERYLQSLGLSFDDVMNGTLDKAVELDFSRTEQKPKKRATKKNKNAQS